MSLISLDAIPYEILSWIVWYSAEDPESLFSLIETSRFLRHHAERYLYRTIDLSSGTLDVTLRFLKSIQLHPRIGSLVTSFHPYTVEYGNHGEPPEEYINLLMNAATFMPNLKTLIIVQNRYEVPKALQWDQNAQPPFQLDRLGVQLDRTPSTWTAWHVWDPLKFRKELVQLLRCQKTLRHFSFVQDKDRKRGGQVIPGLSPEESVEEWRKACSFLEVLEGTNTTVRLLLPNTQKVKALFWHYDRRGTEPLRSPSYLETDPNLEEHFFTPGHREAYGRLENLVISRQISLLPILSTYLTSLKTLVLIIQVSTLGKPESTVDEEDLLMQAFGGLPYLEILVVMQKEKLNLECERIFAVCGKLRRLALWEFDNGDIVFGPVSVERGSDGAINPIEWTFGEETPRLPFVGAGWFALGTQDLV